MDPFPWDLEVGILAYCKEVLTVSRGYFWAYCWVICFVCEVLGRTFKSRGWCWVGAAACNSLDFYWSIKLFLFLPFACALCAYAFICEWSIYLTLDCLYSRSLSLHSIWCPLFRRYSQSLGVEADRNQTASNRRRIRTRKPSGRHRLVPLYLSLSTL